MNKKSAFVIVAIILIVIPFIAVFAISLFTSLFASNTIAIIEALEEPLLEDTNEESGDGQPEDVTVNIETDINTSDELYNKAMNIDLSKIGDNAKPSLTGNYLTLNDWTIKDYIMLYRLVSEICQREEINPTGASVQITPEILLGKMYCESGVFTGNSGAHNFPGLDNSVLAWENDTAVQALFSSPNEFNALGPCGQSQIYQFQHDNGHDSDWERVTDSYKVCLYICKEENPDLAEDKRAVYGTRDSLIEGNGAYITKDFWDGKFERTTKQALEASIKQGSLVSNTLASSLDYKIRPAVFYLPDSLYTVAFDMRTFLKGRSIGNPQGSEGYAAETIVDTYSSLFNTITIDGQIYANALLMLSLSPQLYPEPSQFVPNNNSTVADLLYYMVCDSIPFNVFTGDTEMAWGYPSRVARDTASSFSIALNKHRESFPAGEDFLSIVDNDFGGAEWYGIFGAFACGKKLYETFNAVITQAFEAYPLKSISSSSSSGTSTSIISYDKLNELGIDVSSSGNLYGESVVFWNDTAGYLTEETLLSLFPDRSYFSISGLAKSPYIGYYGSIQCQGFAELISNNLNRHTCTLYDEYRSFSYFSHSMFNPNILQALDKALQESVSHCIHMRIGSGSSGNDHSICILLRNHKYILWQANVTGGGTFGEHNVITIFEFNSLKELLSYTATRLNMPYMAYYRY